MKIAAAPILAQTHKPQTASLAAQRAVESAKTPIAKAAPSTQSLRAAQPSLQAPRQSFAAVMSELSEAPPLTASSPSLNNAAAQPSTSSRAFGFSELGVFGADAAVDDRSTSDETVDPGSASVNRASSDEIAVDLEPTQTPALDEQAGAEEMGAPPKTTGAAVDAPGSIEGLTASEGPGRPALEVEASVLPLRETQVGAADPGVESDDEPNALGGPAQLAPLSEAEIIPPETAEASVIVSNTEGVLHILIGAEGLAPSASTKLRRAAQQLASAYSFDVGSLRLNGANIEHSTPAESGEAHASFSC